METKEKNIQSGFSNVAIIAIVVGVVVVAGIVITGKMVTKKIADKTSVINSTRQLEKQSDKKNVQKTEGTKKEQVNQALNESYPAVWKTAHLPEYNNGLLQRVRNVGGITMITIETDDPLPTVVKFYKEKLSTLGYTLKQDTTNDFISILVFNKESSGEKLTVRASVMKKTGKIKIQLDFTK
jgi:hypothetical protein